MQANIILHQGIDSNAQVQNSSMAGLMSLRASGPDEK